MTENTEQKPDENIEEETKEMTNDLDEVPLYLDMVIEEHIEKDE